MNFKTLFHIKNAVLRCSICVITAFATAQPLAAQTALVPSPTFPRMTAYQGILHPIVTFDKDHVESNFKNYYVVGFPIGLNLWKTKKLGFSVEMVPVIRAENGNSRVANVIFHPGVLINMGHDFTFAGRVAFETSGRYGITPVFNKIVKKGATNSYFVAIPLPVRLGNNHPVSLTAGLQFGIIF